MSLSRLILGLLHEKPFTGYDLNKVFQSTVQHFWSTDQSQIYRALHKLGERGWVAVETVAQVGAPDKKVYALTAKGKAELVDWLTRPQESEAVRESWLARIFFGDVMGSSALVDVLRGYQARAAASHELLEMLRRDIHSMLESGEDTVFCGPMQLLSLDFGLAYNAFFRNWVEDAIISIKELDDDDSTT